MTPITNSIKVFNDNVNDLIAILPKRSLSIKQAGSCHQYILKAFQIAMDQIAETKNIIRLNTSIYNQDEMFTLVTPITGYETSLLEKLNTFNDTFLTYYPTATISYGNPCIGKKTSPTIKTSNKKVLEVLANSFSIREIRGDGNCFLSAFTARFLEYLLNTNKIQQFINYLPQQNNIQPPELKQQIIDTLTNLHNPFELDDILQDNHKVLPFINFFRQLTAIEMKKHPGSYKNSFEVNDNYYKSSSYESLIDKYVARMGVDFDHPMIVALCQKLNFPVQIIDPKIGAPNGINTLDRPYAHATFCRQDNHYFVLYPREDFPQTSAQTFSPQRQEENRSITNDTVNDFSSVQENLQFEASLSRNAFNPKKTIIVKCKVPDGHTPFIRGNGNGLNWEKGHPLVKVPNEEDTWVYNSNDNLQDMEYKILFNDSIWQEGENSKISDGKINENHPQFNLPASITANDILDTQEVSQIETSQPLFISLNEVSPQKRIIIKCKVPPGEEHALFIRGNGNGLSWNQGVPLIKINDETWAYYSDNNLQDMEYKILSGDKIWQEGENSKISDGKINETHPQFTFPTPISMSASNIPPPPPPLSLRTHTALHATDIFNVPPPPTTRITFRFDTGFGNTLFIRGNGPGMDNWEKAIELHNEGNDIWVFETQADFKSFEYKILLNNQWENCDNHIANCGRKEEIFLNFN